MTEQALTTAQAVLRRALLTVSPHRGKSLRDIAGWPAILAPHHKDTLAARELSRQFDSAVDRMAEVLDRIRVGDFAELDDKEANDVYGQFVDLLGDPEFPIELQNIVDRTPVSELTSRVLRFLGSRWRKEDSSANVREFGSQLARIVCWALTRWVDVLHPKNDEAAWAHLAGSTLLVEETRKLLNEFVRTKVAGVGGARIVESQRRDLTSALGRMELFGLPVEDRFRWVPIEIGYLSGNVTDGKRMRDSRNTLPDVLESLLTESMRRDRKGARILVSGRAGFGKTTAAQWVIYRGSQGRFFVEHAPPNMTLLPLFVRLREAIVSSAPPDDGVLLYSPWLRDEVRPRWLENCATLATPLIVLDGWDEIPSYNKKTARNWLDSLLTRFPDAHFVVTSRPEGVDRSEFTDRGFREVRMQALRQQEALQLARKWFDGLLDNPYRNDGSERVDIENARDDLLDDLANPAIGRLVDSPLLTAMMCCLYASGHTSVPEKRGSLYDLVTEAVIHYRDIQRHAKRGAWDKHQLKVKYELIGRVACEMDANDIISMSTDGQRPMTPLSMRQVVVRTLSALGLSTTGAAGLVLEMVNRSIVLQRVNADDVEFLHRSFQDYFAARTLRQAGDTDSLFRWAAAGRWSILAFACHTAPTSTVDKIIGWLNDRLAAREDADRRAVLFTLVECFSAAAGMMAPAVRDRAKGFFGEVLPPSDEDEAKAIAALGDMVLPYLRPSQVPVANWRPAIEALSRVGTPAAIDTLAEYARSGQDREHVRTLVDAWGRLDSRAYAERVLSQLPGPLRISVTDDQRTQAALELDTVKSLTLDRVSLSAIDSRRFSRHSALHELKLDNCLDITSLDWTTELPALKYLSVFSPSGKPAIARLGPPTLWWLYLRNMWAGSIDWDQVLGRLPELRVLSSSAVSKTGNRRIPRSATASLRHLNTLALDKNVECEALDFLRLNEKLSCLDLGWALSEEEVDDIVACSSLRQLSVRFFGVHSHAGRLAKLRGLEFLSVTGTTSEPLAAFAELTRLTTLELNRSEIDGIESLRLSRSVRSLRFRNCVLRDGSAESTVHRDLDLRPSAARPWFPGVEEILWDKGELADLSFLRHFPSLKRLEVIDEGTILSVEGVEDVPDNCDVSLVGTRWDIDDRPVQMLEARGTVRVRYEPEYYFDDGQAVS